MSIKEWWLRQKDLIDVAPNVATRAVQAYVKTHGLQELAVGLTIPWISQQGWGAAVATGTMNNCCQMFVIHAFRIAGSGGEVAHHQFDLEISFANT
jgi:hypothetical protein